MEIDCRKVGSVSPVFIGPLSDSRRAARRDAKYFIAGSLIVVSRLFVDGSWPYAIHWNQSNQSFLGVVSRALESGRSEDFVYTRALIGTNSCKRSKRLLLRERRTRSGRIGKVA